jgi:DNA-binding SARP family transcriptional activator
MSRLSLCLLGPPRIACNDQPVELARRKAVALLVYLAVTGQSHSRDTLATLFWPESDHSRARAGLRRALAALKKALGEGWLEVDRQSAALHPEADFSLDVNRFRHLLAECGTHGHPEDEGCPACLPLLTEAAALYADDFLAGFTLRDSPGFDDWQFFQTQGLRDDLAAALERLAHGHAAQGQFQQAIAHARRRLALDPWHEPAHRHLMQLYAWDGQRAAALRQYQQCAQVLEDEFAAPPGEETTRLYRDIEERRELPPPVEPRVQPLAWERVRRVVNAPPQAVSDLFRDRVMEAADLANHIAGETARLISVVGRAGMGKTALACKVLDDLVRNGHPDAPPIDGLIYLTASELSLDRLVHDIGEMLGEPVQSQLAQGWAAPGEELATKVDVVLAALSEDERYIVLLDNLEDLLDRQGHLTDANLACFVDRSLQSQSGVRLVVTSRERPYVPPEGQRRAPRVVLDEGLPLDEARALLRDLDPDGELELRDASQEDLERAAELARRMPRALELLAFVLRQAEGTLSLGDLLEDEALFLEDALVVERLAAEVYQRLDGDGRRVVEALAVLEEPVPAQAVAYLLAPWRPDLDVPAVLRRLIRGHFASFNRMTRRYALHPVDRAFALRVMPEESASEEDGAGYTRAALEERAAAYYRGLRKPEAEWHSIDDLKPQLREFEHLLRAGQADAACELLNTVDRGHLRPWGHARLLVGLRERLLDRLESARLRGINHRGLGRAYRSLGRAPEAAEHYEAALTIARQMGDRAGEGAALGNLGRAYRDLGKMDGAIACNEEALGIARELGDRRREALWLGSLGTVYLHLGRSKEAIDCYEPALVISREVGDRRRMGYWLGNLGVVYHQLGEMNTAIGYYEQQLEIAREIGDRLSEQNSVGNLGHVYGLLGRTDRAIEHYQTALSIARDSGDKVGESYWLVGLGDIFMRLGRDADAAECCNQAAAVVAETGDLRSYCSALIQLGWAQLDAGRTAESRAAFTGAAGMEIPDVDFPAPVGLGVACLRLGEGQAAKEAFREGASRCEALLAQSPNFYGAVYALGLARAGLALLGAAAMEDAVAAYRQARALCSARGLLDRARRKLDELDRAGYGDLSAVRAALAVTSEDHAG